MSHRLNIYQYAIALAHVVALRSQDPKRQVGAVALDRFNRVVATGYNGLPSGHDRDDAWWQNDDNRRTYVLHAENNMCSMMNRGRAHLAAVTTAPCSACARQMLALGFKEVVYSELYKTDTTGLEMLENFGVILHHIPNPLIS